LVQSSPSFRPKISCRRSASSCPAVNDI
jgi:hypothetical protein